MVDDALHSTTSGLQSRVTSTTTPSRAVIARASLIIAAILFILVGTPFGLDALGLAPADRTTTWWFIAAMALLIGGVIHSEFINREARSLNRRIIAEIDQHLNLSRSAIETVIAESVDPRVYIIQTVGNVRREAAALIQRAISDKNSEINYFGAAALMPSQKELREAIHAEVGGEMSDVHLYHNAMDDLRGSEIKINRFIRFLEPDRFRTRSARVQAEYLKWLRLQVAYLRSNPLYSLYDARRAPQWGGPRSTIVTDAGILDIIGEGNTGMTIMSSRIAQVFREKSRSYFYQAGTDDNRPKQYTIERAPELDRLIAELEVIEAQSRLKLAK